MLIINADDLGRNRAATDAILNCYRESRIGAASAMVYMDDSQRAAVLARDSGIDLGLHLNFSEAFSEPYCPPRVKLAQGRISRFLRRSKFALILYHPLLRSSFREVVAAQIDEFERLFGHRPDRIDGHQHYHLCTNVILSNLIPPGVIVRRSFTFGPHERNLFNRTYRKWVDRRLLRHFHCTDAFLGLSGCDKTALRDPLDAANRGVVELMTHPERCAEYSFLMSVEYNEAIQDANVGDFRRFATAWNSKPQ